VSKQKPKTCAITVQIKIKVLQKGPETKKKMIGLCRWGLNPQLSWLTTVCLHACDRNALQQITAVACFPSIPVPSTHCKEQTKAAIN